jgi:hypothetical protein
VQNNTPHLNASVQPRVRERGELGTLVAPRGWRGTTHKNRSAACSLIAPRVRHSQLTREGLSARGQQGATRPHPVQQSRLRPIGRLAHGLSHFETPKS